MGTSGRARGRSSPPRPPGCASRPCGRAGACPRGAAASPPPTAPPGWRRRRAGGAWSRSRRAASDPTSSYGAQPMRLIQHKREAFWFYRFLSLWYDRWVNPLFWTEPMRALALEEARLEPGVSVVDVGAGTGFTTAGIVAHVRASDVTMLDDSPHQLKRSRAKPELADCARV